MREDELKKQKTMEELVHDNAHEQISLRLQKEKNLSKEEADEQAGKILNASLNKKKNQQKKINISKLQVQLSNGTWTEANPKTNIETLINRIKEMENRRSKNMGTKPRFKNEEEIVKALEKGKTLRYGEDWYAEIRIKPKPISEKQKELSYLRQQYWEIDARIMESEEPSLPSSKLVREKEKIMKKIKELGGTLLPHSK